MNHNDVINTFCDNPSILKELEPFTKSKDKLGFINTRQLTFYKA